MSFDGVHHPAVPIVLDNGACTLKAGLAGAAAPTVVMPNCTAARKHQTKALVGDELDAAVRDHSQLQFKRPFDRGYIVNWKCQRETWRRAVTTHLDTTFRGASVLLTTPPVVPPEITAKTAEVLFEEFGVERLLCVTAAEMQGVFYASRHPHSTLAHTGCGLIIDSGFSFTHAVPLVNNRPLSSGIVRLDVGGKLLTNYLKEQISYRQWNMMDDTTVVNQVKEALCYVAQDFDSELAAMDPRSRRRHKVRRTTTPAKTAARLESGAGSGGGGGLGAPGSGAGAGAGAGADRDAAGATGAAPPGRAQYVLPDFKAVLQGYIKGGPRDPDRGAGDEAYSDLQLLTLGNERIAIPEALFRPIDIGLNQIGVVDVAAHSILKCPSKVRPGVAATVVLCGGNTQLPGFTPRVRRELRALVPDELDLTVAQSPESISGSWMGASTYAESPEFMVRSATRGDYADLGASGVVALWGKA